MLLTVCAFLVIFQTLSHQKGDDLQRQLKVFNDYKEDDFEEFGQVF